MKNINGFMVEGGWIRFYWQKNLFSFLHNFCFY